MAVGYKQLIINSKAFTGLLFTCDQQRIIKHRKNIGKCSQYTVGDDCAGTIFMIYVQSCNPPFYFLTEAG